MADPRLDRGEAGWGILKRDNLAGLPASPILLRLVELPLQISAVGDRAEMRGADFPRIFLQYAGKRRRPPARLPCGAPALEFGGVDLKVDPARRRRLAPASLR